MQRLCQITASTPLVLIPSRPGRPKCRLSWAEFVADFAGAFTAGEFDEIAATIREPFGSFPLARGSAFVAMERRS